MLRIARVQTILLPVEMLAVLTAVMAVETTAVVTDQARARNRLILLLLQPLLLLLLQRLHQFLRLLQLLTLQAQELQVAPMERRMETAKGMNVALQMVSA
jgi:hypothetical protein